MISINLRQKIANDAFVLFFIFLFSRPKKAKWNVFCSYGRAKNQNNNFCAG